MGKLFLAIAAGMAAAELSSRQERAILQPVIDVLNDDDVAPVELNTWVIPESAKPYLSLLNNAEQKHGLPENLLVRVAWQESRFRDDIVTGETISSAGAVGIMQIVPRWHPDVDPLNVPEAITYAAGYLSRLKEITGSWRMALAAYNWGIGNLQNKGFAQAPAETQDYVTEIAGDVLGGYA